jgi:hypothetical protein
MPETVRVGFLTRAASAAGAPPQSQQVRRTQSRMVLFNVVASARVRA